MHLQPRVRPNLHVPGERQRLNPSLGLWGKDVFWIRTGLVRRFTLSFRKGGQDTAGED